MLQSTGNIGKDHIDATAEQIQNRWAIALVRYVAEANTRLQLEQFTGKMRAAARARMPEGQLVGSLSLNLRF
jgi:hypothetical protein